MKPAPFEFARPATLSEASEILKAPDGDARAVAGSQSLGPMLNLRLAMPRILVDLTGISELTRIEDHGESVSIGACVTSAFIEDKRLPGRGLEALAQIAQNIAYRAVRNRGTIGGSLCHADPASDWVSALCAFDAQCTIFSGSTRRRIPVDQFVTGPYENALMPGEILESIQIPRLSNGRHWGYYKVCRKAGEFASALGAVVRDASLGRLRAVIGATNGKPIVIADARNLVDRDDKIDPAAVLAVLDQYNIRDRTARYQQVAALSRAYEQTGLA